MRFFIPVVVFAGIVRAVSITDCHKHSDDVYCITPSGTEVQVLLDNPPAGDPPEEYTDCHAHGDRAYVLALSSLADGLDTASTPKEAMSKSRATYQRCSPTPAKSPRTLKRKVKTATFTQA